MVSMERRRRASDDCGCCSTMRRATSASEADVAFAAGEEEATPSPSLEYCGADILRRVEERMAIAQWWIVPKIEAVWLLL
jgi:hypothetical protein